MTPRPSLRYLQLHAALVLLFLAAWLTAAPSPSSRSPSRGADGSSSSSSSADTTSSSVFLDDDADAADADADAADDEDAGASRGAAVTPASASASTSTARAAASDAASPAPDPGAGGNATTPAACAGGPRVEQRRGLRVLDASKCGLTDADVGTEAALRKLGAMDADVVFLTDNALTRVPDLAAATRVTRLSLKGNQLAGPLECARLPPAVVHLILTDNALTRVPAECTPKFAKLRKLMLARNRVAAVDAEFPALELVRLAQNDLDALPRALLDAKSAPQLKWASFGANPCAPVPAAGRTIRVGDASVAALPRVDAGVLCGDAAGASALGHGTSGLALPCQAGLVVKVFTGRSSDGDAAYERAVVERLPRDHPNLARVSAVVTGVKAFAKKQPAVLAALQGAAGGGELDDVGLAFTRVRGRPAASPPDIIAVSRDIVTPEQRHKVPASVVHRAVKGAASAVRAMHKAGVVHGDVYAHNFLVTRDAGVLIDMGAATITAGLAAEERRALEAMDCRAFSVFASDMAEQVAQQPVTEEDKAKLEEVLRFSPCSEASSSSSSSNSD